MTNVLLGCLPGLESEMLSSLSHRRWTTAASLILLVWDYFITVGDELRYVWRYPLNATKATYALTRYLPLAVQTINLYLVHGPIAANVVIKDPHICAQWWTFLFATGSTLFMSLQWILMLRVYALYKKDKNIGILLVVLFATLLLNQSWKHYYLVLNTSFDCICNTVAIDWRVVYFCIDVVIVQLITGGLLLARCHSLRSIGSRVVKVVNRDGALIIGFICAYFTASIASSTVQKGFQVHLVMIVPISALSVACCRTILNLITIREGEVAQLGIDLEESCVLTSAFLSTTGEDVDT